jgi:radical SAM superfamily enzyme YgiQ (UPF0313 family)
VRAAAPDVIGIGLRNLHHNAYDGTEALVSSYAALVAAVREETRAKVVLGGSGYSLQPEALLDRLRADYGVAGEGELCFLSLLEALERGEAPARIWRSAAARATLLPSPLLRKAAMPEAAELDLLPLPARDLVDPRYYQHDGTDNVQTKRGCAFLCEYCSYPDLEGNLVRDPERVADEVLQRSRVPGVSHIFFVDSVFNVPRAHALSVCKALIRRGAPLPWVCYANPVGMDEELVGMMARAGCQGVEIGADAGTDRMLRRLRKPFRIEDIRRTRALLAAHGISDCHSFVLGAMDETAEEAEETLSFIDTLAPDVAVFVAFMEDREARSVHRATHRAAILELLAREAPRRPGWVVPELGIRFGPQINRMLSRRGLRGPSWLHLARAR